MSENLKVKHFKGWMNYDVMEIGTGWFTNWHRVAKQAKDNNETLIIFKVPTHAEKELIALIEEFLQKNVLCQHLINNK